MKQLSLIETPGKYVDAIKEGRWHSPGGTLPAYPVRGAGERLKRVKNLTLDRCLARKGEFATIKRSRCYIYTMRNYGDVYKIGICSTHKRQKDPEYGSLVWEHYGTKQEMYVLEQALLNVTKDRVYKAEVLEHIGWAGRTEIRTGQMQWFIDIANKLVEEFTELGIWMFALVYFCDDCDMRRKILNRALMPL